MSASRSTGSHRLDRLTQIFSEEIQALPKKERLARIEALGRIARSARARADLRKAQLRA